MTEKLLKSEMLDILSDIEDILTDENLSDSEKLDEIESIVLPEEDENGEEE